MYRLTARYMHRGGLCVDVSRPSLRVRHLARAHQRCTCISTHATPFPIPVSRTYTDPLKLSRAKLTALRPPHLRTRRGLRLSSDVHPSLRLLLSYARLVVVIVIYVLMRARSGGRGVGGGWRDNGAYTLRWRLARAHTRVCWALSTKRGYGDIGGRGRGMR